MENNNNGQNTNGNTQNGMGFGGCLSIGIRLVGALLLFALGGYILYCGFIK